MASECVRLYVRRNVGLLRVRGSKKHGLKHFQNSSSTAAKVRQTSVLWVKSEIESRLQFVRKRSQENRSQQSCAVKLASSSLRSLLFVTKSLLLERITYKWGCVIAEIDEIECVRYGKAKNQEQFG